MKTTIKIATILILTLVFSSCATLKPTPKQSMREYASLIPDINNIWKFDSERLDMINAAIAQSQDDKTRYTHLKKRNPTLYANSIKSKWSFLWKGEKYKISESDTYVYVNIFGVVTITAGTTYTVLTESKKILFEWSRFKNGGGNLQYLCVPDGDDLDVQFYASIDYIKTFRDANNREVEVFTPKSDIETLRFTDLEEPFGVNPLGADKTKEYAKGETGRFTEFDRNTKEIIVVEKTICEKNDNVSPEEPWLYKVCDPALPSGAVYFDSKWKMTKSNMMGMEISLTDLKTVAAERGVKLEEQPDGNKQTR